MQGERIQEEYLCNFGLNPEYANLFNADGAMKIVGSSDEGLARAVELFGQLFRCDIVSPSTSLDCGMPASLVPEFLLAASVLRNR
jgi:hypothetical protein